jgi:hypothetical protein
MRFLLAALLIAALVVAGALRMPAPKSSASRPDVAVAGAPTVAPPAPPAPGPTVRRARAAGRAPRPVRVRIPAIAVDAPLVPLGLDATGALQPPGGFTEAGWWSGGARPGERGPAVIAGHVDSKSGPAVFFRLPQLAPGDVVIVTRRDGSQVRFTVQRTAHYPKTGFPSALVYGPTRRPALRLITCSGTFDRSTGHYLDNTVVYAGA